MQIRISAMNQSAAEYNEMGNLLKKQSNELYEVITKYRGLTCFSKWVHQINTVRNQMWDQAEDCGQLGQALTGVATVYWDYENRIIDRCDGVSELVIDSAAGLQINDLVNTMNSGFVTNFPADEDMEDIMTVIRAFLEIKSSAKEINNITDLLQMWGKSEFLETAGDFAGTVKKLGILKVLGYMTDGYDLVESIENLDFDKMGDLYEKYVKKGIKALTGIKGGAAVIYPDLGWNLGENFGESLRELLDNPSVGSAASLVWNTTWGTLWDTGTGLASDFMELVYGMTGKDFDEADYEMAMDWLGGQIDNVVGTAAETLYDKVASAGEAIVDGACVVFDTVASWFSGW